MVLKSVLSEARSSMREKVYLKWKGHRWVEQNTHLTNPRVPLKVTGTEGILHLLYNEVTWGCVLYFIFIVIYLYCILGEVLVHEELKIKKKKTGSHHDEGDSDQEHSMAPKAEKQGRSEDDRLEKSHA